jgi:VIT1/CCC1 family predicted Fe2+/Mn2+ transporter
MTDSHSHEQPGETGAMRTHSIHLPAPTAWPFLMALGLTLIFAALVTSAGLGILGAILTVVSIVGWFREVLPQEAHEDVAATDEVVVIVPSPERVARIEVDETHRAQLPLETFPVTSGIIGGIAGGIAMVIPAEIYGIIRFHSIWYVVNLLGGAGVGNWVNPTVEQMSHFRLSAFVTANIIQGATTLLVGLLYGALLPIWPKRPILLGGLLAPVAWTGLLHSVLGIVNPFLEQHIDWWSFAAAQVIFGLVAGYVVTKYGKIKRLRQVPLAVRLGVETPGLMGERDGDERKP